MLSYTHFTREERICLHLSNDDSDDIMTAENVCSAAGKEDNNAVEEEN